MARKKKKSKRVPPEEFVVAWQKADSVEDVVKAIGGTVKTHQVRASKYRKKGVPLKKFASGGGEVDWETLTKLAEENAPKKTK